MPKDLSLGNRSGYTQRFNFVKDPVTGDVSFDETQAHGVMNSVFSQKNRYWADKNHGSNLYLIKNVEAATPSQAEAVVLDGLLPMQQRNLIKPPTAKARTDISTGLGQLYVDLNYSTPQGPGKPQVIKV